MYSNKEGVEYPTGWALNPLAYQHLPSEQVDWAALAQQWIQMKETCPPAAMNVAAQLPPPPPPPKISTSHESEGGEAPMDVETGDVDPPNPPAVTSQQWNSASTGWDGGWNSQWGSWGWQQNATGATKPPLMPTPTEPPYQGYTTGNNNFTGYSSTNNSNQQQQQSYSGGYWSGEDSNSETKSRLPARGGRFSPNRQGLVPRRGGPHIQRQNQLPVTQEVPDTTQTIDAAKRKQLPAWIREGLEKMEREKQKQLDREREEREREEYMKMKELEEANAQQASQPDDGVPRPPVKSKFDSDSEKSDNEDKEMEKEGTKIDRSVPNPPLLKRSQEEIMRDLMLNVRRTLTEILLEVTDDQICGIAKEELSRVKSRSQATREVTLASKLQGLSAIGGGLGLGIYGDSSDSDSESEADSRSATPDRRQREKSGDITDSQLQETIRRRKADFEKTSREIELRIAEEERAELQRAKKDISGTPPHISPSTGSSPERTYHHAGSDGESTSTNNRKDQNNSNHKKLSRNIAPSVTDSSKRHTPEKIHKEEHKHSSHKDVKNYDSLSRHDAAHESKRTKDKSPKKSKTKSSDSSSSEDSSSNSEDSFNIKKNSDSGSESSESSTSSKSSSKSDSSYKRSKKKKRRSSDDSKKHKSKSKKRKSKHSDKESDKFSLHDKKYDKDESVTRDSRFSSRNSVYSPERKSVKSKNSRRSRSQSDDRRSRKYESSSRSSYRSRDRSRDRNSYYRSRSRDRKRDRSREKLGRSWDYRNRSKDRERSRGRRNKPRDKEERSRERRGRSREGRRDRRGDSRSYYY